MFSIAFLGIDGVGKSTQITLLYDYLIRHNYKVKIISFSSKELRDIVTDALNSTGEINNSAINLAIALDIRSNIYTRLNMLEEYDFVLFDRYINCRLAIADVYKDNSVHLLEKIYSVFPQPNISFYLYADILKVQENLNKKDEKEDLDELMEFHRCYLKRIYEDTILIDTNKSIEDTHNEILTKLGEAGYIKS